MSVVGSNLYLIDEDDNIIGERKYPEFHSKIKEAFCLQWLSQILPLSSGKKGY